MINNMRRFLVVAGLAAVVAGVVAAAALAARPSDPVSASLSRANFGRVVVGSASYVAVTFMNATANDLEMWSSPDMADPFYVANPSDCLTLAANSSCTIDYWMSPAEVGKYQQTVTQPFAYWDSDLLDYVSYDVTMKFVGTGFQPKQ